MISANGTLRYGVNPGAGVLDGDAFDEILTGAGAGAVFGPHVRAWNYDGIALSPIQAVSYFAYGTLRYGVCIHRGDVDGDGFAEPLTGPGPGAMFGPQVRGWNYDGAVLKAIGAINFNAFATSGYGVNIAGGGLDADVFDEIACANGPGPSFTPQFAGFDYDASQIAALPGFSLTLTSTTRYGGRVGLGDTDGDSVQELLAAKGRDPGADARVSPYDYSTGTLVGRPAFEPFPGKNYGSNPMGMQAGF